MKSARQTCCRRRGNSDRLRNASFNAAFLLDEHQPFRLALKQNDLLDWTPRTPMLLCGSHRDAIVDFNNALAARAAFGSRGVEVTVVDVAAEIPPSASGSQHHSYAAPLCYAAARTKLLDPVKRGGKPVSR